MDSLCYRLGKKQLIIKTRVVNMKNSPFWNVKMNTENIDNQKTDKHTCNWSGVQVSLIQSSRTFSMSIETI